MAPRKKQPDLMDDLKKFMNDSGITDELKVHAGDLIKGGLRRAREILDPAVQQPLQAPRPQYYFQERRSKPEAAPVADDPDDPYVILKVARDAHIDDITAVYHRQAHRLHPDKGGEAGEFDRMKKAWEKIKSLRGVT